MDNVKMSLRRKAEYYNVGLRKKAEIIKNKSSTDKTKTQLNSETIIKLNEELINCINIENFIKKTIVYIKNNIDCISVYFIMNSTTSKFKFVRMINNELVFEDIKDEKYVNYIKNNFDYLNDYNNFSSTIKVQNIEYNSFKEFLNKYSVKYIIPIKINNISLGFILIN